MNFICKHFQPDTTGNLDFSKTYQQEIPELESLAVMNLLYIQVLNVNLDYNVKNKQLERTQLDPGVTCQELQSETDQI